MVRETVLSDAESVYDQTEVVEMGVEEKSVVAKEEEKSVKEEVSTLVEKESIPEMASSFEEKPTLTTPPTEEKQEVHECTPTERGVEETKDFTLQINGVSIRVSASQSAKGKCTMKIERESKDYDSYYSTSNNEIEFSVEHNNRRYKMSINRDATMKMLKKRAVSVGLSREC